MEMALKTSRNEVIYQILESSTESTEIFIPSVERYKWTSGVAVLGAKTKSDISRARKQAGLKNT